MTTASATTAPKRWIMFALKRAREQAGKSRQDVVDHLDCTAGHVSHLETGRNLPSAAECEKLLVFYGLGDRWSFFRELFKAAKKGRDWWKAPAFSGAEPEWFDLYLGLEAWARVVASYDALVVPGLFQTPEYAQAIITAANPGPSEPEAKRRVDLRMERQKVLDRAPEALQVWSVLDEAALRRPVGDAEVMRAQLHHLMHLPSGPTSTSRCCRWPEARTRGWTARSPYWTFRWSCPAIPERCTSRPDSRMCTTRRLPRSTSTGRR